MTGRRILITRTRQQASELAAMVEAAGAEAILIPTIELAPPSSFDGLDEAVAGLSRFAWVIFTSANAVQAFAVRAKERGIEPRPRRIAVIGPATRRAVEEIGLTVDLVPREFIAESLAQALVPFAPGAAMLLVRAEEARDTLPEALTEAGARLTIAEAYRSLVPAESVAALQELFAEPARYPDAITFTSSSTATNLFALLASAGILLPREIVRASIGPVTSRTLCELGYPPACEAAEATIASLCESLLERFRAGREMG